MAYFKPYIDETGIHLPLYQEVLDKINEFSALTYI